MCLNLRSISSCSWSKLTSKVYRKILFSLRIYTHGTYLYFYLWNSSWWLSFFHVNFLLNDCFRKSFTSLGTSNPFFSLKLILFRSKLLALLILSLRFPSGQSIWNKISPSDYKSTWIGKHIRRICRIPPLFSQSPRSHWLPRCPRCSTCRGGRRWSAGPNMYA